MTAFGPFEAQLTSREGRSSLCVLTTGKPSHCFYHPASKVTLGLRKKRTKAPRAGRPSGQRSIPAGQRRTPGSTRQGSARFEDLSPALRAPRAARPRDRRPLRPTRMLITGRFLRVAQALVKAHRHVQMPPSPTPTTWNPKNKLRRRTEHPFNDLETRSGRSPDCPQSRRTVEAISPEHDELILAKLSDNGQS